MTASDPPDARTLAALLAHELSQPLASILLDAASARLLVEPSSRSSEALRGTIADIERSASRAADIVAAMRALVVGEARGRSPLRPLDLVRTTVEGLRPLAVAAGVDLHAVTPPDLPEVEGSWPQLERALHNLVVNAIEACRAPELPSREVTVQVAAVPPAVRFTVRDSGPGIPPRLAEQLFAPFVTRREGGMGIGLALVRAVAGVHGGRVWVETRDLPGAVVHLDLPLQTGIRHLASV